MNYFKTLKLQTGEILLCTCPIDYDIRDLMNYNYPLILVNPVVLSQFIYLDDDGDLAETSYLALFNPASDNTSFPIKPENVINISSMGISPKQRYQEFLNQLEKKLNKPNESKDISKYH